jgi:hypothetical protein
MNTHSSGVIGVRGKDKGKKENKVVWFIPLWFPSGKGRCADGTQTMLFYFACTFTVLSTFIEGPLNSAVVQAQVDVQVCAQ